MASLESYEELDDGYSDEEEDWEVAAADASEAASWCKDHHETSSQLSELVSVADFQKQCSKVFTVACGSHRETSIRSQSKAIDLGITESELSQLHDKCK